MQSDLSAAAEALTSASERGWVERLQILLAPPSPLSADTYVPSDSMSLLQNAAFGGHVEAVHHLLSQGASCTRVTHNSQMTALHLTCNHCGEENRCCKVVHLLLNAPNDTSVVNSLNLCRWSPLHFSAMLGRLTSCEELLKAGAQVNCKQLTGSRLTRWQAWQ